MLKATNLHKYYGSFHALKGFSLTLNPGEVVALLGLNGAGKTTCIRILTGYMLPSEGEVTIDGQDVFGSPVEIKEKIGYLPEVPPLYPELTVEDYLRFIARMRGLPEHEFESEFLRVTQITQLEKARASRIRHLSLGYRKRVGIAQALVGSPPLLIFDEPISGLDPRQIIEVRQLIRSLAGKHTVLISSHILTEVSRTCDRVVVIHDGQLAGELAGDMEDLEERFIALTEKPVLEVGK